MFIQPASARRRYKYELLLVLLLVSLVVQSFDLRGDTGRLLSDAFRTGLTGTIFLVVFERGRERWAAAVILVPTIALGWGRHFMVGRFEFELALTFNALMALFLWAAVWAILCELFRGPVVGARNVLGAICGYLIAADAWSGINLCAYLLVPSAYSINPELTLLLANWHSRLALFSYYSFTQMLTIGYSDITPVRAPATTLSLFAALFGMFYTAIVVSQFVGLARDRKYSEPVP
jgi:hypothetical protein